jgi:hypothetical protein
MELADQVNAEIRREEKAKEARENPEKPKG